MAVRQGLPDSTGITVRPDKSWVVPIPQAEKRYTMESNQIKHARYLLWRIPRFLKDSGEPRENVKAMEANLTEFWCKPQTTYDDFIRHVEYVMYQWLCSQSEHIRHVYRGG